MIDPTVLFVLLSPASNSIRKAIPYYLFETLHDCWSNDTRLSSTTVVHRVAMDTRVLYSSLKGIAKFTVSIFISCSKF